jgi:hypothetical protein
VRFRSALLKSSAVAIISLATFSFASVSKAAILLDNLGGARGDGLQFDDLTRAALGFSISPAQAQDATWTFTIHVQHIGPTPTALAVQLVSDSGGEPGTSTALSLTGGFVSDQGNFNIYTFSGSGPLSATTYWLVASSSSASTAFEWVERGAYTSSGATFAGAAFDDGSPAGWTGNAFNLSLQLGVTPVPEPAQTGAIAALFLIVFSLAHTFHRPVASKLRKIFS